MYQVGNTKLKTIKACIDKFLTTSRVNQPSSRKKPTCEEIVDEIRSLSVEAQQNQFALNPEYLPAKTHKFCYRDPGLNQQRLQLPKECDIQ
ncbi:hypothetical protein CEXT_761491 [Caerostris extrusa]|uniref:Uncharacterized protein n=1 Tax=Caerostris extrusa TaxID=172846 RepID=A0AAV4QG73_CAEEX|nr:hypothetical protein CEXT_761491 [Caerostris extrusa]